VKPIPPQIIPNWRHISLMNKSTIFTLALLFFSSTTIQSVACPAPRTEEERGDYYSDDGAMIFVGMVTAIKVFKRSDRISCLSTEYQPLEILLGNPPDKPVTTLCGPAESIEAYRSDSAEMADFFLLTEGAEGLVGLTGKKLREATDFEFISDLRIMYAGCYPMMIRLDGMPRIERTKFVAGFRENIEKERYIPRNLPPLPIPRPQ